MQRLDMKKVPRHIAIIMDGNGRWAKQNALKRIDGHRKGAEAVRSVVRACRAMGVNYLTLYAFSVENWSRPAAEVDALMVLLEKFLIEELPDMLKNDIRFTVIGNVEALPGNVRTILSDTIAKTGQCSSMTLVLALSYGGRDEIVNAVRNILVEGTSGRLSPGEVTKEVFSRYLYTRDIPDPDLLIRTSGEYRLSNFLLWQSAYTELYFVKTLWPDFSEKELEDIIIDYQGRERRFGLTSDQIR
ncbi:MAG: isoprenyl transferase [Deltaproteobacteria bacterium]|nr:isoprenyl transferase [Deltaproteobacteria bacterium]MBN2687887.1 isoprenyl transferase [Deltaproteobacteria bacterium]